MRPWLFCFPLLPALLLSASALGSPPEDLLSLGWAYQPEMHAQWEAEREGVEAAVRAEPIAGRYERVEEIGSGGMGQVWRGYDSASAT